MQDFLDAPPEGATNTGGSFEKFKGITYKACKTPKAYAQHADAAASVTQGNLGFSWYDKESRTKNTLPELTFVALEFYAGVSGYDGSDTSYWSNRAKDTRDEPLALFSSHSPKTPIVSGLYKGKAANGGGVATIGGQPIPNGASFTVYCKAFCLQLREVVEIEVSSAVQEGMKIAVSDADARAGRRTDPEKVFILGLANGDYLWGFHLSGYEACNREWKPYDGNGDLFFRPVFHAGILNAQKQQDLHATCVREQSAERARHAAYRARHSAHAVPPKENFEAPPTVGTTTQPPANPAPHAQTNVTANHTLPNEDPFNFPARAAVPAEPPATEEDPLPF